MIKIYYKDYKSDKLSLIDAPRAGAWINVVAPSQKEIDFLVKEFKLPGNFIHGSLDTNERPHIDEEGDIKFIVVRTPINDQGVYFILPVGIIITGQNIFTISLRNNPLLEDFEQNLIRSFSTTKRVRFLLQIMKNAHRYFDLHTEEIKSSVSKLEQKLLASQQNKEVIEFLDIEKTMAYYHAAITSNGAMLDKLVNHQKIPIYQHDKELLEDIIMENKEIAETLYLFINNLSNTMDAYASIISNNLNITMKLLASLTIILGLPNIVTSFYGMNVDLPFDNNPWAYWIIIVLVIAMMATSFYIFIKRRWL